MERKTTTLKLDKKDLTIIGLYCQNPDITQEEIAKELGISQPSVMVRVRRLRSIGALVWQVGLDPFKTGLHVAKVDVTTTSTTKILRMFQECPYFLNGFITSGKNNLCLFFVAEDIATLEAIVDNHLRVNKDVQDVEFNIVISSANDLIIPLKLHKKTGKQACGANIECKNCPSYEAGRCMGCPIAGQYKGWLWLTQDKDESEEVVSTAT
mgnify:CR=1 FL=1